MQRKLSKAKVKRAFDMYYVRGLTQQVIARKLGVSQAAISLILARRTYKGVA